jgi:hypothetical protein
MKDLTLQTVTVATLIDFIYDIFGIHKYKNDPKTNQKITESLTQNISNFVKLNEQKWREAFDSTMAV